MFKGIMTKWPVQKLTQGTTQNSYNIMTQQTFRKHIVLCFSGFSLNNPKTTSIYPYPWIQYTTALFTIALNKKTQLECYQCYIMLIQILILAAHMITAKV